MTTVESMSALMVVSALSVSALTLFGCADQNLVQPSEVSLPAALTNVGTGLVALKESEIAAAQKAGFNSNWNQGLMPSSVVVTLNLAASKSNSNQLMISASAAPPVIPASVSGSEGLSSVATGSRASSITITYSSLYFNPTGGAASNVTITTNYSSGTNATSTASTGGTNSVANSTNYSVSTSVNRPSNLNDPATVNAVIGVINANSTNPGPETIQQVGHPNQ